MPKTTEAVYIPDEVLTINDLKRYVRSIHNIPFSTKFQLRAYTNKGSKKGVVAFKGDQYIMDLGATIAGRALSRYILIGNSLLSAGENYEKAGSARNPSSKTDGVAPNTSVAFADVLSAMGFPATRMTFCGTHGNVGHIRRWHLRSPCEPSYNLLVMLDEDDS